jgi:hypothetical protein
MAASAACRSFPGPHSSPSSPPWRSTGYGHAVAVWAYGGVASQVVQSATASAGGRFGRPQTLSSAHNYSSAPDIALAPGGQATAVWSQIGSDGLSSAVMWAVKPESGRFGRAQSLEDGGKVVALNAHVRADGGGRVTALWQDGPIGASGPRRILAATRAPGGRFGRIRTLDRVSGKTTFQRPVLGVDARGHAYAVWERQARRSPVRGSVRTTPTGSFAPARNLSARDGAFPSVAAAGSGHAIATWEISIGCCNSAGIDARFGRQ